MLLLPTTAMNLNKLYLLSRVVTLPEQTGMCTNLDSALPSVACEPLPMSNCVYLHTGSDPVVPSLETCTIAGKLK